MIPLTMTADGSTDYVNPRYILRIRIGHNKTYTDVTMPDGTGSYNETPEQILAMIDCYNESINT